MIFKKKTKTSEEALKETTTELPAEAAAENSITPPTESLKDNPYDKNAWSQERKKVKNKRKRIRLTILLIIAILGLVGISVFLFFQIQDKAFETMNQPFDVLNEFTDPMLSGSHQQLETFASDLCVLDMNVRLDSSLLNGAQKGLLFDIGTPKVLFAQGVYDKVYPASITKIMTAMVAFRYGNMSDTVYITPENLDLEAGSQVCGFRAGDPITMEQLMNCLLVYSGNDAASAIAEHVGGTVEHFVELMNSYAQELGCTGTHFTNPHGLTDEDHYTTVYDIYLMLRESMKYTKFMEIIQQSDYTLNYYRNGDTLVSIYLPATDHYLTGEANAPKSVTILGGKTGTTSLAGNCLALLCQDAYGKPYCSIVMGAKEKEDLYIQMNSLLQNINH